jgi:hypothetical protein
VLRTKNEEQKSFIKFAVVTFSITVTVFLILIQMNIFRPKDGVWVFVINVVAILLKSIYAIFIRKEIPPNELLITDNKLVARFSTGDSYKDTIIDIGNIEEIYIDKRNVNLKDLSPIFSNDPTYQIVFKLNDGQKRHFSSQLVKNEILKERLTEVLKMNAEIKLSTEVSDYLEGKREYVNQLEDLKVQKVSKSFVIIFLIVVLISVITLILLMRTLDL